MQTKNWKVAIRPTRSGIRIRTQSACRDSAPEAVERAITKALLSLRNRLEK